jgi:hypothetical protein
MMTGRLFVIVCMFLCIMTVFYPGAYAQDKPPVRLISFNGDVTIDRLGERLTVVEGTTLQETDEIRTGRNSFADIAFDKAGNNVVRIEQNSEIIINNSSPEASELTLFEGSVLSRVRGLDKGSSFTIRTPLSISGARGSGWRVERKRRKDAVESHEDKIFVAGLNKAGNLIGKTILHAGSKIFVKRFKRPSGRTRLSDRERDRWNVWKKSVVIEGLEKESKDMGGKSFTGPRVQGQVPRRDSAPEQFQEGADGGLEGIQDDGGRGEPTTTPDAISGRTGKMPDKIEEDAKKIESRAEKIEKNMERLDRAIDRMDDRMGDKAPFRPSGTTEDEEFEPF